MRNVIEKYLLAHFEETEVFTTEEIECAGRRRDLDNSSHQDSLVHYFDMQTTFEILLRNRGELPLDYAQTLSANASSFPNLVPIRHRVMHGRPLDPNDPQRALALLAPLSGRHWDATRSTYARLRNDPTWEPYFEQRADAFEKTLHNLPEVDYDETSLVGRRDEGVKLLDLLKRRRHSVITVTGEGGIGKTALALDIAYTLLDAPDNPYEAILWVSLKTEKLTAYGIEELKDAVRGVDSAIVALGQGIAHDFKGSLTDLAAGLEGIDALVIIDNLESAQGNEIVEMYDTLPTSVNYLFTSRWGVGQLERIFPLPPLSESEAVLLFRKFAKARDQKRLAGLKNAHIINVVKELRYSPLAIRWFVLASASGNVPLDVLRNQTELLEFCVANVVENLSEDSRAVLTVLRALDRSIGFDEFAILTEMTIDALRQATQQLTRGSLVLVESEASGAIAGRLALTPTARSYLSRPEHTGAFIAKVLQRERQFKASLEVAVTGGDGARLVVERVQPRDSNDHSAMYLLQTALSFAKSGQYGKAVDNVARAKSFNPEYAEVYRISGLISAMQNSNELAVSELKAALRYATDDLTVSRVNYSLADIISRRLHDAALAQPHAQIAYDRYPCGDTAFLLGKLLMWIEEFKPAQEYIQEALDVSTGRHRTIVTTVLVDSWARWSESDFKQQMFEGSLQKATAGFRTGVDISAIKEHDSKLMDVIFECVIYLLRSRSRVDREFGDRREEQILRDAGVFLRKNCRQASSRKRLYLREALKGAIGVLGETSLASGSLQDAYDEIRDDSA